LRVASLAAGACSVPRGPTTRAPANVSCVGDHSPALRQTGMSSRKGEGLPGYRAILFVRAMVEHPAGYGPLLAHITQRSLWPSSNPALSASGKVIGFGAAFPWPARLHTYASPGPFLAPAQGLLPTRAGSPLAGRVSHPLDDEQSFMKALTPPVPFDQPCLVALNFLSAIRHSQGNQPRGSAALCPGVPARPPWWLAYSAPLHLDIITVAPRASDPVNISIGRRSRRVSLFLGERGRPLAVVRATGQGVDTLDLDSVAVFADALDACHIRIARADGGTLLLRDGK